MDDRDRKLAREIGARLERGSLESADERPAASADGAFVDALLAYRRRTSERADVPSPETSIRLWQRIDRSMRDEGRTRRLDREAVRPDRKSPHTRRWTWVAGISMVVVAGLVSLLLLRSPTANLLAAAEADILEYVARDGSVVTLRPFSRLYLVEETDEQSLFRLTGEAFFAVSPRSGRTFAVKGGEALVSVLGTRFNFNTWAEWPSVYLEEGSIRFEHLQSGASTILEPGQWSRTTDALGVLPPVAEPATEHLDWLSGELVFNQRSAGTILAELEQHFNTSITVPAAYADETITGRILLDDRQQALDDLGLVMGGRFREVRPGAFRFDPD